jgi:hypothetical protein
MYSYDRTAGELTDPAFERLVSKIEDEAKAMRAQVKRLGGIAQALKEGHKSTLEGQIAEVASSVRVLQRRLGFE